MRRVPSDEAASGLEHVGQRVHRRDALDPALQQAQRDVDRREEEHEEDRHLHEGRGLDRAKAHRHAPCPEEPAEVHEHREHVEADEVDRSPADPHADRKGDDREHGRDDGPAEKSCERVAEHDPDPAWRGEQEALREAVLEVPSHAEPREDTTESG